MLFGVSNLFWEDTWAVLARGQNEIISLALLGNAPCLWFSCASKWLCFEVLQSLHQEYKIHPRPYKVWREGSVGKRTRELHSQCWPLKRIILMLTFLLKCLTCPTGHERGFNFSAYIWLFLQVKCWYVGSSELTAMLSFIFRILGLGNQALFVDLSRTTLTTILALLLGKYHA